MATTPEERKERQLDKVRSLDEISDEEEDRILDYANAINENKTTHKIKDENDTTISVSVRSVEAYVRNIRITVQEGLDLLNASTEEVNSIIDYMHDEIGKSKSILGGYQVALEHFYRFHSDLEVNPNEINKYGESSNVRHDGQDMFSEEEIQALRNACAETKMPVRNRAFLELLIFTGQRLGALLTLRIKDVELEGERAYIHLNDEYAEEHGGLKGAIRRGRKRPIFGAEKYVRDWLEYHPYSEDRESWLFIGDPSHWKTDKEDHWSRPSADQRLRQIGKVAEVDKPVNAHNFRHYTATVLYRDYDLRKDTIRMLLGHAEGSKSLEQVYSHVFDEDFIRRAEEKMGYREEEDKNPFTPDTCPTCGALLEEEDNACSNCGSNFAPNADYIEDQIQEDTYQDKSEAEGLEEEAVDLVRQLSEDPETLDVLKEALED
jgi:integrase